MNTYTYTARNIENPGKVLTFTLQGEYLKVNLTGVADTVSDLLREQDQEEGGSESPVKDQAASTTLKVLEEISGPLHVSDVAGKLQDGRFALTAWKRVGGLRAAPIVLKMGRVDNPQAAEAFLKELNMRKNSASRISNFFGPLDYWFGWLGLALVVLFFIRKRD